MSFVSLKVNGRTHTVDVNRETPLLYILRNDLDLRGPKFGCGLAQCGACTVIIEGQATRSCITPVGAVAGSEITTLEGLGSSTALHPIQRAFVEQNAGQCGYCINGFMMAAKAFIDRYPKATDDEIEEALSGNLCRCGAHLDIFAAV